MLHTSSLLVSLKSSRLRTAASRQPFAMALEKIGTAMHQGLTSVGLSGAMVYMQQAWSLPGVKTSASTIFALYALSKVNNVLNSLAWDNYTEPKPWDWRREVVLITGGCSGLGEATTRKLAERGVTVVVLDIQQPRKPLPPSVHFYQCDVSSEEEVKKTGAAVRKDVGAPTVLVNNAGVASWSTVLEDTPERLQKLFGVNVFAHFYLVREFLPDMIRNDHGHVITISSVSSQVTIAGLTDYSCTKAATISFHEGLRQDLKHKYNAPHVRTR